MTTYAVSFFNFSIIESCRSLFRVRCLCKHHVPEPQSLYPSHYLPPLSANSLWESRVWLALKSILGPEAFALFSSPCVLVVSKTFWIHSKITNYVHNFLSCDVINIIILYGRRLAIIESWKFATFMSCWCSFFAAMYELCALCSDGNKNVMIFI